MNMTTKMGKLALFSSSSMERGAAEQRMCRSCSEKWHSKRNRSLLADDATAGPRYSSEVASSGKLIRKYFLDLLGLPKHDAIRLPF